MISYVLTSWLNSLKRLSPTNIGVLLSFILQALKNSITHILYYAIRILVIYVGARGFAFLMFITSFLGNIFIPLESIGLYSNIELLPWILFSIDLRIMPTFPPNILVIESSLPLISAIIITGAIWFITDTMHGADRRALLGRRPFLFMVCLLYIIYAWYLAFFPHIIAPNAAWGIGSLEEAQKYQYYIRLFCTVIGQLIVIAYVTLATFYSYDLVATQKQQTQISIYSIGLKALYSAARLIMLELIFIIGWIAIFMGMFVLPCAQSFSVYVCICKIVR